MKYLFSFFCGVFLALTSCSTDGLFEYHLQGQQGSTTSNQTISSVNALSIAEKVLNTFSKSRNSNVQPSFDYVLRGNPSRNNTESDTLAYVINYPNDGGFVIVSSTRNVYPVLAFSDTGNFKFDNEVATKNFIDRIDSYIESASVEKNIDVSDFGFDGCYAMEPLVETQLNQLSPWNKYVIQEHPNCPVGCVAVATALVMLHSKEKNNISWFKF